MKKFFLVDSLVSEISNKNKNISVSLSEDQTEVTLHLELTNDKTKGDNDKGWVSYIFISNKKFNKLSTGDKIIGRRITTTKPQSFSDILKSLANNKLGKYQGDGSLQLGKEKFSFNDTVTNSKWSLELGKKTSKGYTVILTKLS